MRGAGWGKNQIWWLRRDNLQIILLAVLFISALPQTVLFSKELGAHPGQKTIAYKLFGPGEDYGAEEIAAEAPANVPSAVPVWRMGAVESEPAGSNQPQDTVANVELGTIAISGGAVTKPSIMSGIIIYGVERKNMVEYVIEPGDSLSSIAYRYGVSVSTLMWENGISLATIIRPGDRLRVPPTTGVMHTIKKGDTLKKIAALYNGKVEDIIKFNNVKEDGTDLVIGERVMVPNGVKVIVVPPKQYLTTPSRYAGAAPASSIQAPSVSGYVWPTACRAITQYFGWRHLGLDIGCKKGSPIYAVRGGTVVTSQCGWNSGYGCYVIIDHGNGVRTLYGHNSQLLVSPGDQVLAGQTIALMGNTGKVRGVTGVHSHFEIRINGSRVNPLKYVR